MEIVPETADPKDVQEAVAWVDADRREKQHGLRPYEADFIKAKWGSEVAKAVLKEFLRRKRLPMKAPEDIGVPESQRQAVLESLRLIRDSRKSRRHILSDQEKHMIWAGFGREVLDAVRAYLLVEPDAVG